MKKIGLCATLAGVVVTLQPNLADAAALSLDGVDDWVEITGATGVFPSGNAPFTVGAWVNPDVHSDNHMTFWGNQATNEANGFRLRGGGVRHYFWSNDHDENIPDISGDTTGPNGDGWHHFAVTWDGSMTTWYWNGSPIGTRAAVGITVADANHRIGSRLNAEFFDGFIDEVSVWGFPISAADIAAGWNLPIDLSDPNVQAALIAYYDFEGGLNDLAALGGSQNGVAMGGAVIDTGVNAPLVPEPSTGLLGGLAALLLLRRRR